MGTITINSSTLNTSFNYKNDQLIINGTFQKDAKSGELQNINGSCYLNNGDTQGDYIGNFNGYPRNGEIRYDLTEMTRQDSNLVWNAIDAIEAEILPVDE